MTEKWTDVKKRAAEGYAVAKDRAVLLSTIGKLKLEVVKLRRGITLRIGELGRRTYGLLSEDSSTDVSSDTTVAEIVEQLKNLESEVTRIEEEIRELSSQKMGEAQDSERGSDATEEREDAS
jgi:hypothetical protein